MFWNRATVFDCVSLSVSLSYRPWSGSFVVKRYDGKVSSEICVRVHMWASEWEPNSYFAIVQLDRMTQDGDVYSHSLFIKIFHSLSTETHPQLNREHALRRSLLCSLKNSLHTWNILHDKLHKHSHQDHLLSFISSCVFSVINERLICLQSVLLNTPPLCLPLNMSILASNTWSLCFVLSSNNRIAHI